MRDENKTPRNRPAGPHMGPGRGAGEKAKDFKGAMTRLFRELKAFKVLIIISLTLAALGSVLSILAPNKLSKLTDEISKGLVIKSENLQKISTNIKENLNEEKLSQLVPQILSININEESIMMIMSSNEISNEDKTSFQNLLKLMDKILC